MAWALVAGSPAQSSNGSVASFPQALGASAPIGARIFVATATWRGGAAATVPTVTDSVNAGNYTEDLAGLQTDNGFQFRVSVWSMVNTVSATPTVTVAPTTNNGGTGCIVWAVTGLDTSTGAGAIDKSASAAGTGGTASSGATAATTAANEYVVGVYGDDGYNAVTANAANVGAGYTYILGTGHVAPSGDAFAEHKDSGASGSAITANLNTGVPGGSVPWSMLAVVYKLAAAVTDIPPGIGPVVGLTEPNITGNQAASMR